MSGQSRGVQALIKQEVPQAIYIHCMNHRLNLVIVDVCKGITYCRNFFDLLESLYVFLSGSVPHAKFTRMQGKLGMQQVVELQRLSDIRWACQVGLNVIKLSFQ